MELVATLIAGAGSELSERRLQEVALKSLRTSWLAKNEAADIFSTGMGVDEWHSALATVLDGEPVDVIVQPAATRRKKLLAADMESTMIEQEMLDELASDIGVGEKVAHITRRAMNGELDFRAALRERMGLFGGKPVSLLETAAKRITHMPGAATLVATMKANGAQTWLITGGFSFFAAPVAAKLGFDRHHANELMVTDDVITGEISEPLLDRMRKKVLLEEACAELGIALADSIAVGDGANDVPMLEAANEGGGLGIAYHAKPKVREAVAHQVNYGDLTALLYAQGYKKSEFRT